MQFRDFKKLHKLPLKRSLDKNSKRIKLSKKLDFKSYFITLDCIL
ncbi:hypothetical protein HPNQ4228_1668 [Helicobacter pylori NQ4228]|nr:hypothetical protein HPNQ4228_1668 [Helicobacter pylori NQ4228]